MSNLVWALTSPPGSAPTSFPSFDEAIAAAKKLVNGDCDVFCATEVYFIGPKGEAETTAIVRQWPKSFIPATKEAK